MRAAVPDSRPSSCRAGDRLKGRPTSGKESVAKKKYVFIEYPGLPALRAAGGTFDIEPSTLSWACKASKVPLPGQPREGCSLER